MQVQTSFLNQAKLYQYNNHNKICKYQIRIYKYSVVSVVEMIQIVIKKIGRKALLQILIKANS